MTGNSRRVRLITLALIIGFLLSAFHARAGSVTGDGTANICTGCSYSVPNGTVTPINNQTMVSAFGNVTSNTITFNMTVDGPLQGQYKFTVTTTGILTLKFNGIQPPGIATSGLASWLGTAQQIVYSAGVIDSLCIDYIGGVCGKAPGGGGAGGGTGGSSGGGGIAGAASQAVGSPLFFPILLLTGLTGFILFIGIISRPRPKRRTR